MSVRWYLYPINSAGQGVVPRNCNQQPRVVKIDLILCIKAWVCLALTITREHQIFCK